MMQIAHQFSFVLQQDSQFLYKALITVPQPIVQSVYEYLLHEQRQDARTIGFAKGTAPKAYIEYVYKASILERLKEFFLNHCVIPFLYRELIVNKMIVAGEPTLLGIDLDPAQDAKFIFQFVYTAPQDSIDWKKNIFKAPQRKNYKDLDRQVESFLKEEDKRLEQEREINIGDWVCFDMTIVNHLQQPLLGAYKDRLWLRIGEEDMDIDVQKLFVDKKLGDHFTTCHKFLQEYMSTICDGRYFFELTIIEIVPALYFSLEQFKRQFKLKTARETHQKLIEVFSFRNDLSQRRETIEAVFKLLLGQCDISLPLWLIDYQEEKVLQAVHHNPDYYVYKSQRDFREQVRALAVKQLKEMVITDFICFQDNIVLADDDVSSYLNLHKRPRTKEFVYYSLPLTKINGQETIISSEIINRSCLREKTLNYVIHYLTKR